MAAQLLHKRITRQIIFAALGLTSLMPALDATYMLAKAKLAQELIAHSWRTSGEQPWPWADTAPVARLTIPRLELDTYVLSGATGESLAFGPGMVSGSAKPGTQGVTMIAAHRDSHFKPLQQIATSDMILIQGTNKQWHSYRVANIGIADSRTDSIQHQLDQSRLILTTCYPFDALVAGGPLRFVIEAELVKS